MVFIRPTFSHMTLKQNGGDPHKDELNDQPALLDGAMKSRFFFIRKIKNMKIVSFSRSWLQIHIPHSHVGFHAGSVSDVGSLKGKENTGGLWVAVEGTGRV